MLVLLVFLCLLLVVLVFLPLLFLSLLLLFLLALWLSLALALSSALPLSCPLPLPWTLSSSRSFSLFLPWSLLTFVFWGVGSFAHMVVVFGVVDVFGVGASVVPGVAVMVVMVF